LHPAPRLSAHGCGGALNSAQFPVDTASTGPTAGVQCHMHAAVHTLLCTLSRAVHAPWIPHHQLPSAQCPMHAAMHTLLRTLFYAHPFMHSFMHTVLGSARCPMDSAPAARCAMSYACCSAQPCMRTILRTARCPMYSVLCTLPHAVHAVVCTPSHSYCPAQCTFPCAHCPAHTVLCSARCPMHVLSYAHCPCSSAPCPMHASVYSLQYVLACASCPPPKRACTSCSLQRQCSIAAALWPVLGGKSAL